MPRRAPRVTSGHEMDLTPDMIAEMRAALPRASEDAVAAIITEVPSYANALSGPMGEVIGNAVQLALGGFISLASGKQSSAARTPAAPAVEGAYQLGRGEARTGRSMEALLAAYRIGARVSWREMSRTAVSGGIDAETLSNFAELTFAYIDELSAASVAGHTDELESSGRVRQRHLERLAQLLLAGAPADAVHAATERAEWTPPTTLTAVLVPQAQARAVAGRVDPTTLQVDDVPELENHVLLLVPDAHGRRRATLLRTLQDRGAVAGPARPWLEAGASFDRAARAHALQLADGRGSVDTEDHLVELVLRADPAALADLRARALAPLADLRPATAEKLTETLRAWLLHHGRRDEVAASLFVHAQTVRYRMGQIRELYGDRLDDPRTILELTLALGTTR